MTAVAALVMFATVLVQPVGRDEAVFILELRRPFVAAMQLVAAHETQPLGFYAAAWLWPRPALWVSRLLGWLPAVGVAPLTWLVAERLSLRPLLAGLLAATSPFLAWSVVDSRMYPWLALWGVGMLLGAPSVRTVRAGVLLGGLAASGLELHYFALLTVVAGLATVWWRSPRPAALAATLTTGLLSVPAAAALGVEARLALAGYAWQDLVRPDNLPEIAGWLYGGSEADRLAAAFGLAAASVTALGLFDRRMRVPALFALLGAGVPLVAGVFVREFTPRYAAAAVPSLLLLLAAGLERLPRPFSMATVGGALVLAAMVALRFSPMSLPAPQWVGSATPVVLDPDFAPNMAFYYGPHRVDAFHLDRADRIGLWALPPATGRRGRDSVYVGYCEEMPALPDVTRYPGNVCRGRSEP